MRRRGERERKEVGKKKKNFFSPLAATTLFSKHLKESAARAGPPSFTKRRASFHAEAMAGLILASDLSRGSQRRRNRRRRRTAAAAAAVLAVAVIAVAAVAASAATRSSSHVAASSSASGEPLSTSLSIGNSVRASFVVERRAMARRSAIEAVFESSSIASLSLSLSRRHGALKPFLLALTRFLPRYSHLESQLPATPHGTRRLNAVVGAFGGDIGSGPRVRFF